MREADERYQVRNQHTASQDIDGEIVVINFDTYHYYGLNHTGTAIWKLLEAAGRSRGELADAMAGAFRRSKSSVAGDVDILIDRLLSEGLIETTATIAPLLGALACDGDYVPPVVEKHEKLDQLILSGE